MKAIDLFTTARARARQAGRRIKATTTLFPVIAHDLPGTLGSWVSAGTWRVRDLVLRAGVVGLVVFVVMAAGVLAVTVPIPGAGCPSALKALISGRAELEPATAPVLAQSVITQDGNAIDAAQSAISNHASDVADAQDKADAAADLTSQAEEASYTVLTDDTDSLEYDVESAESDVEYAQESVDTDKESLSNAQDDAASQDDTYGIYADAVGYAQDELDSDTKELATAKAALSKAKTALSKGKTKTAAAQKNVKALTAKAEKATAEAAALTEAAESTQASLTTTLKAAQDQQTAHVVGSEVALAFWTHQRREDADATAALNALRSSCRASGGTALSVAGGLGGIAVLLVLGNVIAVRRQSS